MAQSGQGKDQSEGWGEGMLEWDQEQAVAEGGPRVRGGAVAEIGGESGPS